MVWQAAKADVRVSKARTRTAQPTDKLLRLALYILAGVEAIHTAATIWVGLSGMLPMSVSLFPSLMITQELNVIAVFINALATLGLLDAANNLRQQ